jgi:hypothetical protein
MLLTKIKSLIPGKEPDLFKKRSNRLRNILESIEIIPLIAI